MNLLRDQNLFWDVDIQTLDRSKHSRAIIERVLERGSWANIKELIDYYGKDIIIETAKKASWFSDKTLHFICGYFNVSLIEMRCYTRKQSNPLHYL
jgi:hypothetical protein